MSQYTVQTVTLASQPALVVRGKARIQDAGEAIGGAIGKAEAALRAQGLQPAGAPFTRTFAFEDGVLSFESGFPVAKAGRSEGDVLAVELPGGQAATTVHTGPQDGSEKAYEALHAWMAQSGKQPAGAPWERYDAEASMQIYFPIQ